MTSTSTYHMNRIYDIEVAYSFPTFSNQFRMLSSDAITIYTIHTSLYFHKGNGKLICSSSICQAYSAAVFAITLQQYLPSSFLNGKLCLKAIVREATSSVDSVLDRDARELNPTATSLKFPILDLRACH
ncbi:hypothetical protein ACSBR1_008768 [Camellia fascicularis]